MSRFLRRYPVASFFLLAWLFSWVFMVPLALANHRLIAPLPGWLHHLSAYGPLLAAMLVSGRAEGAAGMRAWWSRLTRWRAGPGPWALAVSPLVLYLVAAVAERAANGVSFDVRLLGRTA